MFENNDNADRGQVGIGTLIVFIAMVLVAAIAAGVLINTAGFLQSKSEETGQQSGEQVTNRLQVLQTSGLVTQADGDTEIGAIELIGSKAPGSEDIDLEGITMQIVDDTGTYDLAHENVVANDNANVDGAFAHVDVKDEDGSLDPSGNGAPVINDKDDRARIQIDVGSNDIDANRTLEAYEKSTTGSNDISNIKTDGLLEGETAQVRITTQSGAVETVRLQVPSSLSGKSAASL